MMHVDVIKNEWLAGYQVLVARLYADNGSVRVDSSEPERWEEIVLRPYIDEGQERTPRDREFLAHLHLGLRGDFLFATELHDERDCPYHSPVVAIRPADAHGAPLYA